MRNGLHLTNTALSAIAIATLFVGGPAAAQDGVPSRDEGDVVVTANKREESLRQVAAPISAVTGEDLAEANANSLSDYITRLPGVVFNDYQPGISEVVIRGIAATTYHEQGQTTVGYYLNEIPLVEPGFPIGIPDVDTFDLKRAEVLRGPQGTLFGSSTLGGSVNYIVNTADTGKIDAAGSAAVGYTKNAGEANWAARAMINVPVIKDVLAVRLVALQRFDAGYLDNPGIGVDGSNDFRTRGLRGSVVLTPAAGTTLSYLSTYQDTKLHDQTYLDLENPYIRDTARAEPQTTDFWLNSLRLDQETGAGTFTVLGSVIEKNNSTVFTYAGSPYVTGVLSGEDAAYSLGEADANIKQAEARFASGTFGAFRFLVGASYQKSRKTSYDQIFQNGAEAFVNANPTLFGGNPGALLAPGDRIYGYVSDSEVEDVGVFGEVSFKPVDAVELTVGGRYFWNNYSTSINNQAGALGPDSFRTTDITASVENDENGFTPKVTLALRPTSEFMAYVTYSQGYRIGGINPNAGLLTTIPNAYDSDTVDNYEAGVKFSAFDRKLFIDATVFSIDWKDIQARLFGPAPNFFSYVTNAGSANIGGVEFAATLQPVDYLTFSTSATYQDAKLTDFLPDTFGPGGGYASGTRLPGSSEWTVANNIKFELPDSGFAPSIELAHRYLSSAPVNFANSSQRGDFNIFDVRVGATIMERFRLLAFANNVFDEYGILNAPFAGQVNPAGSIVRPRTVGLRLDVAM